MITMRRTHPALLALTLAFGVYAAPAHAQSLTSMRGLGYPVLSGDARTSVMGGLGIGLQGVSVPFTNPASTAGLLRRGVVLSLETNNRDIALGDATASSEATRFPLVQAVYPVGGLVLSVGYASTLDQSWGVTRELQETVGSTTLDFQDRITSTGGLGQLQLGAAMPIGERLAVGAGLGVHTGSQRIRYSRTFSGEGAGFRRFDETFGWRYFGPTASLGALWDPVNEVRVGASVSWAGTVSADSADGRASSDEFDLPLQLATGASAYLAPALLAAVSARWSGWSAASPGTSLEAARDTWEFGAGLELDDPARRAVRSYPLRIGFQYRQLPFVFAGNAPSEWFAGAGVGVRLGTSPENPLGLLDFAVQRGERTAGGDATVGALTESVWRFSLSLSLFGT